MCILWNIASLLLQLSANEMKTSDNESLKLCLTRFKWAASIFCEIRCKTAMMSVPVLTSDLKADTLVQLERYSLAGAQTVILIKIEKMEKDTREGQHKKYSIMAKIAAGVADIYHCVYEMKGQEALKNNAENMKSHFISQSHLYQAAAYKAQSNHGHRIAHLKIAAKCSNSLVSH